MTRNRLYLLLTVACLAGYIWLYFNYSTNTGNTNNVGSVCMIKQITNIPCPSCGATRAVNSFLKGNVLESLYWNPIGIILITILFISPIWITFDSLFRKDTLFKAYLKSEIVLQQKIIAIPAIILVLINWIWNIYKGL